MCGYFASMDEFPAEQDSDNTHNRRVGVVAAASQRDRLEEPSECTDECLSLVAVLP
jgi:hypothetical protein